MRNSRFINIERSGGPAIALILGALVMSGTAKALDSGWRANQPRIPIPSIKLLGKRQLDGASQNFNWSLIHPTASLTWTHCYGSFECARLAVPMDYSNPSGEQAAVAIVKYPSKIPPGQKGYLGPILFNPGGPGGSGVQMVLSSAQGFADMLGDDFDLIGFDPRGIGFTTPGMFTFPSEPEEALFSTALQRAANETSDSLGTVFAKGQLVGKIAKARIPDIAQHVSTPTVARDMLSIVEAFGLDKLQYWGFSYGSVLGATFAAMFPDNVGRLIIDGVLDSENYYKGKYAHDLQDTDKALLSIYQACVDAGPSICPIFETSTDKVSARVDTLLESLKIEPISFYNETSGEYGSLDYSAAKGAIFTVLYTPHQNGAALTVALALAEQGEGQPLFTLSGRVAASSDYVCSCSETPSTPFADGYENTLAIACGDSGPFNGTLDDMKALYAEMAQDSQFAELWTIYLTCQGWQIGASERFSASFNTSTSFPILVIGNTADPVTPISSARKMSQGFIGSVLLTQDTPGHTSSAALSNCTTNAVRDYFRDGKLPSNGTVCSVESSVFGTVTNATDSSGVHRRTS